MDNFIKSSIDLFNIIPIDECVNEMRISSKELIEHGYFIIQEGFPPYISQKVKNILVEKSFKINKTFYNNWNDILLKHRNQLLIDQLFHYATVWLKDNDGVELVYIPNTAFNVKQSWTIPLRIIKQETKDEIKNKAKLMLYANIALKEETIVNIFNIISTDEIELTKIKNRDSKILIYTKLHIIPKAAEDIIKCLIYSITGKLVFVKNKDLNDILREKTTSRNALFWIKNNEIVLSQIFNRYKSIFLCIKNGNEGEELKPYINKISHLSKKYHIPKKSVHFTDFAQSDSSNGFQVIRYLKYLKKEKQPRSFVIRNGKIWCERDKFKKMIICRDKIKKMLESYSLKQSPHTKVALPVSEKNFVGNYPMGSEFTHTNLIVGIYWKNNQRRVDLDLSCMDIIGKIGWDSNYYRDKNIFSGDITDAPNGANEYLYFGNIDTPKLIQVNYFNFASNQHEVEFDIIVGKNLTDLQNVIADGNSGMLCQENVIASMKTSINSSKTKTLGIVYPGGRFVIIDKYIGKKAQTNGVSKTDLQILIESFTSNLFFEDFIDSTNENNDNVLDLQTEHISKDKIISIFY